MVAKQDILDLVEDVVASGGWLLDVEEEHGRWGTIVTLTPAGTVGDEQSIEIVIGGDAATAIWFGRAERIEVEPNGDWVPEGFTDATSAVRDVLEGLLEGRVDYLTYTAGRATVGRRACLDGRTLEVSGWARAVLGVKRRVTRLPPYPRETDQRER